MCQVMDVLCVSVVLAACFIHVLDTSARFIHVLDTSTCFIYVLDTQTKRKVFFLVICLKELTSLLKVCTRRHRPRREKKRRRDRISGQQWGVRITHSGRTLITFHSAYVGLRVRAQVSQDLLHTASPPVPTVWVLIKGKDRMCASSTHSTDISGREPQVKCKQMLIRPLT